MVILFIICINYIKLLVPEVPVLHVNDLPFAFMPGKGCQKALFTLNSVVNYNTI